MKRRQEPEPEDARLREVLFCVREGLRKLVPCQWGAPPYDRFGAVARDQATAPYLVVSLRPWYSIGYKAWRCQITIADGDDFLLQRCRPFTWEDWQEQVTVYDQITAFDTDMFSLLEEEGFR